MSKVQWAALLGQPRFRIALEQILNEVEAVKDTELLRLNLDPVSAVSTVCGALPKIIPLRPVIISQLPAFSLNQLDSLETYALGLMQAHALFCAAKGRKKDRAQLAADSYNLRGRLLEDVTVLMRRGLLSQVDLSGLRGPNGHLNIACDVMTLASIIRNHWKEVSGFCAVTSEELDRAEVLSEELSRVVGDPVRIPEHLAAATLQRQRVYTLFIRAYTDVRVAVAYVRSTTGDADKLAPSLYRKKRRPRPTVDTANTAAATESMDTSKPKASVAVQVDSTTASPGAGAHPSTSVSRVDSNTDPFLN
jgi:hypothetical protein